ncbi:MAG TPA: HAD family hydrolase [Candidatus Aminicenantes bacterium]|nr:HAD-IA family hydrolase [Candidatus Aminicenantes bacterium]HHF42619.1 HAD family hydrolase [Candidatus Aminicenantes bacterium]
MGLKCFIFDLDGTIVETDYDWARIKEEIGTGGQPILSYLQQLPPPERQKKYQLLEHYEKKATERARLRKGVKDFLNFLRQKKVKIALVTNNSRGNTEILLRRFGLSFDQIITRESGLWKPSGRPIQWVMNYFQFCPEECAVVGDSLFDILAAKEAGVEKIFILAEEASYFSTFPVKVFASLAELQEFVRRKYFPD